MIAMVVICIRKGWSDIESRNVHPSKIHSMSCQQSTTLVIGLGNTILSDDGVGIYVARGVEKLVRGLDVEVKEASLGGLELLELMKGFQCVILIDAILTGKYDVGALVELQVEDLKGGSAMLRHQIGLSEALGLGRELGMDLPEKIRIYGIEVKDILTFSESCTPEIENRISTIVELIMRKEFPAASQ